MNLLVKDVRMVAPSPWPGAGFVPQPGAWSSRFPVRLASGDLPGSGHFGTAVPSLATDRAPSEHWHLRCNDRGLQQQTSDEEKDHED
jgi:hypothetical protein